MIAEKDLVLSAIGMGYIRTSNISTILQIPSSKVAIWLMELRREGKVKHSKHTGWRLEK